MKRTASAHWSGNLQSGAGTVSTASSTLLKTPFSFHSRFEQGQGTNPEELLAAAHAGCFTMALSLVLQKAGLTADSLDTNCVISLDKDGEGFSITSSHLELRAKVPNATPEAFEAAAQAAKANCPVSKLYDTEITLDAKLV